MTSLVLILIIQVILLAACCVMSANPVMTPQVLYTACFIPGIIYCFPYIDQWDLYLSPMTVLIFAVGGISFVFASWLTERGFDGGQILIRQTLYHKKPEKERTGLHIHTWKTGMVIVLQILAVFLLYRFIRGLSPDASYGDAIYYYRYHNAFLGEEIPIPKSAAYLRYFSIAAAYLWMYVLLRNLIYGKAEQIISSVCVIALGAMCSVMLGDRTAFIQMIIGGIVQFYFLYYGKYEWKVRIPVKVVIPAIILMLVLVMSFQAFGNLLGRGSTRSFNDYIAMYLSAEIKNLDLFVKSGRVGAGIRENQTFIKAINWFSGKFGLPDMTHHSDVPSLVINGFSLGNVATCYYAYYHDTGISGVVIYPVLMAVIMQIFYRLAKRASKDAKHVHMSILLYSYLVFTCCFSFFSHKFYETMFSSAFLKYLASWIFLKLLIEMPSFRIAAGRDSGKSRLRFML